MEFLSGDDSDAAEALVFDQCDEPYLGWVATHPDAFVLNTTRNPRGYSMLHRADCQRIKSPASNYQQDAFTAHAYFKVCAASALPLIEWAEAERALTMPLRVCASCDQRHKLVETVNEYQAVRERVRLNTAAARQRAATAANLEAEQHDLQEDLDELQKRADLDAQPSTRSALIEARRGQGKYREMLLALWGRRCAVSGLAVEAALIASHAVSWRKSTDAERLDPHNGLPLAATIDKLFDRHLVAFDSATGEMLVSKALTVADRQLIGLPLRIDGPLSEKQAGYLARHRDVFLQAENGRPNVE